MTKLAVAIAACNYEQAVEQIDKAVAAGAEILELRTDYLCDLNASVAERLIVYGRQAGGGIPLIVTCRDKAQGGRGDYPLELRVDILVRALKDGAQYVDFEYSNFIADAASREKITLALAQACSGRLILSEHDFGGKFADLGLVYERIAGAYPAVIPKIVYRANHINDCFEAFDLLYKLEEPATVFCMTEHGMVSRILAKKLNSFVTFASLDDSSATAAGQLTIEQMKGLYRYDQLGRPTRCFGVIGWPVGHSLSPKIHNGCFEKAQLGCLYLLLPVSGQAEQFDRFMENVLSRPWLGFAGFSVTIPHKKNALEFVRRQNGYIEPLTERIGAANTVIIDEKGRLGAYNTDYAGAMEAIYQAFGSDIAGLRVAVVGAGGAGRAIVAGLADAGAKVRIYNRTVEKAQRLAEEFGCQYSRLEDLGGLDAQLLVNCTSIGMWPQVDKSPVPRSCLSSDMAVFDTIYNPQQTLLLQEAAETGALTISGMEMFINQAAEQFRLFTGRDADKGLMRQIISRSI